MARAFRAVDSAIADQFGKSPIYLREGGSIPVIADFKKHAGLDALMIGLFTPLDNLHAPDESFSIELMNNAVIVFERLIKTIAQER